MGTWQIQQAKARLSELIHKATTEGPQNITVRGHTTAVVLSKKEYDRLRRPKPSFVEFMRSSPLVGVGLELEREQTSTRKVDIG